MNIKAFFSKSGVVFTWLLLSFFKLTGFEVLSTKVLSATVRAFKLSLGLLVCRYSNCELLNAYPPVTELIDASVPSDTLKALILHPVWALLESYSLYTITTYFSESLRLIKWTKLSSPISVVSNLAMCRVLGRFFSPSATELRAFSCSSHWPAKRVASAVEIPLGWG